MFALLNICFAECLLCQTLPTSRPTFRLPIQLRVALLIITVRILLLKCLRKTSQVIAGSVKKQGNSNVKLQTWRAKIKKVLPYLPYFLKKKPISGVL